MAIRAPRPMCDICRMTHARFFAIFTEDNARFDLCDGCTDTLADVMKVFTMNVRIMALGMEMA